MTIEEPLDWAERMAEVRTHFGLCGLCGSDAGEDCDCYDPLNDKEFAMNDEDRDALEAAEELGRVRHELKRAEEHIERLGREIASERAARAFMKAQYEEQIRMIRKVWPLPAGAQEEVAA